MADYSTTPPDGFVSYTKKYHSKPYPAILPTRPELSAAGKNVVITGGGTGIGKATAIAFAQAGAASVAIIGRRIDRLQAAAADITAAAAAAAAGGAPGTRVLVEAADTTKRETMDAALQRIVDQVGKIDVFVANAGILSKPGAAKDYDLDELRRVLETNVIGALASVQAFLPRAAPGATLFGISSAIAHIPPMVDVFSYSASKAAAAKVFDYVAAENPDLHVVNVHPGVVNTGINPDTTFQWADEPELPASFLVWLASPEAKFLRGKFVWVNWDVEELMARAKEIASSQQLKIVLEGVPV